MYQDSAFLAVTQEQMDKILASPQFVWLPEVQKRFIKGYKAVVYVNRAHAEYEEGDLLVFFDTAKDAFQMAKSNPYLSVHTVH